MHVTVQKHVDVHVRHLLRLGKHALMTVAMQTPAMALKAAPLIALVMQLLVLLVFALVVVVFHVMEKFVLIKMDMLKPMAGKVVLIAHTQTLQQVLQAQEPALILAMELRFDHLLVRF